MDISSFLVNFLATAGGGAVVAFGLFKWLGTAWLEAKFSENLEDFRHERAKELERLRAEIDGTLRAKIRYQEKQFEAVTTIWEVLKDAQSKLLDSISPLQQYADIRHLTDKARHEYLSSFDLQEWQIEEVLRATDGQEAFIDAINRIRFNAAARAFSDFDRVTRRYEIFFDNETFTLLRSAADSLHSVLVSKEFAIEDQDHPFGRAAWKEYETESIPKVNEIIEKFRMILS